MNFVLIGGALGGIGLFLLGMRMMTDGLKVAAGVMLRDILAVWTRTRLRGLLSGILITGIVQSSSAVTVAAIGFVNAGVLPLGRAMWVIFGSNVGTTMTGWIVALVGFDFKIEAFALPLLGIGMFMVLTGASTRRGALGEAVAGFGVFFLGIATLKATFAGLGKSIDLAAFAGGGILNDALFVLLGIIMTTLVQSSSAVIAIALTAAVGGVLTIEAGAAVVIGANVGTTSTAILSVLGATSSAKRVAVSHVTFNVLTGLVALLLLPLLLVTIQFVERTSAIAAGPAATLALFHTVFNVLGVLVIWPVAGRLERWLGTRFVTEEEDESRPRFLDKTSLEVPALAVNCILEELRRVGGISLGIAQRALADPKATTEQLWRRHSVIEKLNESIVLYIQSLQAAKLPEPTSEALTHPVRALLHFVDIAESAIEAHERRRKIDDLPERYASHVRSMATLMAGHVDAAGRAIADPRIPFPEEETIEAAYEQIKSALLRAASDGELTASQTEAALETTRDMRQIARSLGRAGRRIGAISDIVQPVGAPAVAH